MRGTSGFCNYVQMLPGYFGLRHNSLVHSRSCCRSCAEEPGDARTLLVCSEGLAKLDSVVCLLLCYIDSAVVICNNNTLRLFVVICHCFLVIILSPLISSC